MVDDPMRTRPDPGWPRRPSVRALAAALIPGLLTTVSQDPSRPTITTLRQIFLGFVGALVVIGALLLVLVEVPGDLDEGPMLWLLLLVGTVTAVAGSDAARRRPIVCTEPARLARQVTAMTFLALATANTAALTGFVAAFLADAFWPYLIGLVPTAFGLARTAPTRARVHELDRRLDLVGCDRSASEVLYALPGDPADPHDHHPPPPSNV